MKTHRLLNIPVLTVSLSGATARAQTSPLPVFHFERLTENQELSNKGIQSVVVRDTHGYVWIGTAEAVDRLVSAVTGRVEHARGFYLVRTFVLVDDCDNALKRIDWLPSQPSAFSANMLKLNSPYEALRNLPGYRENVEKHSGATSDSL